MKLSKGKSSVFFVSAITLTLCYAGASAVAQPTEPVREGTCDPNPFPDKNPPPGSIKHLTVPMPPQLNQYVKNQEAAIMLGKALFWDMNVGSDGVQSCASCHFRAGADPRSWNTLAPGGKHIATKSFELGGPNYQLRLDDFPLHKLADPTDRHSQVIHDYDEVVSSPGIRLGNYFGTVPGAFQDIGRYVEDIIYNLDATNSRRVPDRNTPTFINAVFNRRNFWDGRADEIFNGVNSFGVRDPNAHVLEVTSAGGLRATKIRLTNAALASLAVAPPVNDVEMSFVNRPFRDVGKRLLPTLALAKQIVHPDDSVLGPPSRSQAHSTPEAGLIYKYEDLIAQAFQPQWWKSERVITATSGGSFFSKPKPNRALRSDEYRLMEYNFSLFFGLAIQMYGSTLVSDDAPIDRHFDGQANALTQVQKQGLELFEKHACSACHSGAEFTNSSTRIIYGANGEPGEVVERMLNGNCETVAYDQSFYNIGVRPHEEDLGIGDNDPYGNPLSVAKLLTMDKSSVPSPELLTVPYPNVANPPLAVGERISNRGAFKVPSLRNIALTAPYFHNGGQATLRQVLEFYNRGGDFREHNTAFIDFEIGKLSLKDDEIDAIVAFLQSLTDERVLKQSAPFDHPQLMVPNGEGNFLGQDLMMEVPAVGRLGGRPLPGFLE